VNYTAVGFFVLVFALLLLIIIYWLSAGRHKSYNTYVIYFKEPVSGLNIESPVKFNGVDVGYVKEINLETDDPQEVKVIVKIDSSIPITQSTVATLMAQGITGITYIGLKAKTPRAPILVKHPGAPYPVIPSEPSLLVQLNSALRDVTEGLKNIGTTFKLVFDDENRQNIKRTLANLSTASAQFPDTMSKIRLAALNLSNASKTISTTAQSFVSTSDQIKQAMQSGDIVLQNLSQQTLPEIYKAASYLKDTLINLKDVSAQMKQNPSVIVRGTVPTPTGPGE
jgi:phospholipid/cholesterol/gamma-HCH transport system substrate-binding protein